MKPVAQWLLDGRRLHLQHGPIDLIIEVSARTEADRRKAFDAAAQRFDTVLTELVDELAVLRQPVDMRQCAFSGAIAKRMWRAANDCECIVADCATTPMIAVAGSVADEVLHAILNADNNRSVQKISINNGGDIALYIKPLTVGGARTDHHASYRVGVVANPNDAQVCATIDVGPADAIGGIATSGWRGRSLSRGIADSVTVLAANAATADAAATMIANAVRTDERDATDADCHLWVQRRPARELDPDSDLGDTLVTTDVKPLPQALIDNALNAGARCAMQLEQNALIAGACIFLQQQHRVIGAACDAINRQLAISRNLNSLPSKQTAAIGEA